MVMCIFLFLLWLILNGKVTLEICLFGVVITGAVYAFCVAALGCRPQADRRFLKRLGGYVVYGAILVREIIRARLTSDRIIGINLTGTLVAIIIAILAYLLGEDYLADVAIVYVVLSFIAVMLLCRIYINLYQHKRQDKKEDESHDR